MKVLVTGGAGYIGMVVIANLLEQGFYVRSYDRHLFGCETFLSFPADRFHWLHGDICDRNALFKAMEGMDAAIHLAALVGEDACSIDEQVTYDINLAAVKTCLSLAEATGVKRMIFLSTCSNYGVHSSQEFAHEKSPLHPLSIYAKTKVSAEEVILCNSNTVIGTVLRFGTICGLSPRMRFDLLVNEMALAVAYKEAIQIFSPNAWRPFLHVKDAARAISHCLQVDKKLVDREVFNVVSENYQKIDLVKLVQKHFPETEVNIVEKKTDLRDYRVNAVKIYQELNFAPIYNVEQAFLETVRAVKSGMFFDPRSPKFTSVPKQDDVRRILWSKA